jgi:formylglycine-generating enzyme required for sulfatase activity
MVVIPSGSFLMGSPPGEEARAESEGPLHRVTIGKQFAIGKHAVTFAEYDHFCEVNKREKPADHGWGRGRRPVINVSWSDAVAFCEWLAKETEELYRLPSEAEWEYVCRAGTSTPFSFGQSIWPRQVNYLDLASAYRGEVVDRVDRALTNPFVFDFLSSLRGGRTVDTLFSKMEKRMEKKTLPVASLPANPWGLHEMHGNVREWVEDFWHENYLGAPVDGSAWIDQEGLGTSNNHVLRGGCWSESPGVCRSASRGSDNPEVRDNKKGFRIARTIS